MEVKTVVAESVDWLMILDEDGDLCTIKRTKLDIIRRPVVDKIKVIITSPIPWLSAYRKQIGLIGLISFGSMATGCMTEHVLTHYQFEKMVDHAIELNPNLEDFDGG